MDTTEIIFGYRHLLEEVAIELSNYSVSFVKLDVHCGQEYPQLGGSGTLVFAHGKHAILTADHVLENLPTRGEVGLSLSTICRPRLHRFTIDMSLTTRISIARGATEHGGPDLGLLLIPAEVGKIGAVKSFYNLSRRRDQILSNPPPVDQGAWLLCGMAAEWTSDGAPELGYQIVKEFHGICGAGIVTAERQGENFDYIDFEAKYNKAYEGPQSFKGFSGGGLWQVAFDKNQDGNLIATDKILSGVAFYQSTLENERRTISCHGRQSIYGAVVDALAR
jgi:hypothetical protein